MTVSDNLNPSILHFCCDLGFMYLFNTVISVAELLVHTREVLLPKSSQRSINMSFTLNELGHWQLC
jgi:hypothetical protein